MATRAVNVKTETDDVRETITTPIEVATVLAPMPEKGWRVAEGTHHAIHPETGLEAVWTAGEVVPEWALPQDGEPHGNLGIV